MNRREFHTAALTAWAAPSVARGAATATARDATVQSNAWGHLRGRFIYDGNVPAPNKIIPTSDVVECGNYDLYEEKLLADKEGGLSNVVVYLYTKRGTSVDVHPDYADTEAGEVLLDNVDFRFVPHICLMRTTQTLVIKNSDPIGHNVSCHFVRNAAFNEVVPVGASIKKRLKNAESMPVLVDCSVHPWEIAYVVLRDDPYMTASNSHGAFEIKNIPAGTHEFCFWHEMPTNIRDLAVGNGTTSRRGRIQLTISADRTLDLGDIRVGSKQIVGK